MTTFILKTLVFKLLFKVQNGDPSHDYKFQNPVLYNQNWSIILLKCGKNKIMNTESSVHVQSIRYSPNIYNAYIMTMI